MYKKEKFEIRFKLVEVDEGRCLKVSFIHHQPKTASIFLINLLKKDEAHD